MRGNSVWKFGSFGRNCSKSSQPEATGQTTRNTVKFNHNLGCHASAKGKFKNEAQNEAEPAEEVDLGYIDSFEPDPAH